MKLLTNLDLNKNQLQNVILHPLATAPSNAKLGQIYYNSVDKLIYHYDGSKWEPVGTPIEVINNLTSTDTDKPLSAAMGKSLRDMIDAINDNIGEMGGGDMMKATYDINGDGIVDDAEKLGGQSPSYYAKASDLGKKVDKVEGKGLSTNDYTTAEKNKLSGIEAGAEVNVTTDWNSTEGKSQILNKPTKLSQFTNDEGFIDNSVNNLANYYLKSETYNKTEVSDLISKLATIEVQLVSVLPETGKSNIIYLVPKSSGSSSNNIKDEYLWTGTAFEKIGDTEIDLSGYLSKTGDGKDVTVTFTQAGTRSNIVTGESLSIIMGKLSKAFADLKSVAFTGSYNDLSNKPTTIKNATFTISTIQTSNTKTLTGTKVLGVTVLDTIEKDVVFCDVDINSMTVTVSTSVAPTNDLEVIIIYI